MSRLSIDSLMAIGDVEFQELRHRHLEATEYQAHRLGLSVGSQRSRQSEDQGNRSDAITIVELDTQ